MSQTVLSADDDAAVRSVRNEVLRKAGFEVIEAATGTDALRLAAEKQPALVVLALELPGTDGFAVCSQLKADPRTASIPVLHISSQSEPYGGYPESLESGADAYLQEPIEPPVLIAVARALIRACAGGARTRKAEGDAFAKDRLSALIDSIPDEVWFADTQGRFTLANPSAAREFKIGAPTQVDVEELAKSLEVYRADGSPRPVEEAPPLRALRGETVRNQEEIIRTPVHGELRYRQVSASPVRDAAGHIIGSVSAVRDITERKQAEQALRESEAVLRSFFDSPGMMRGIVEMIAGRIVHSSCNAAAAEMLGVARESIAGMSATEAGASEEIVRTWAGLYEQSLRTGKPVSMEYARRDADGQERWLLATASHLGTGPSGNPRFAYTILDLTERKRAEEALRQSEKMYRAIGESIDYGVWVCAPDGRNTYVSESFLKLVGLTQEQCSDFGWGEVLHPEDAERTIAAWKECVRTEGRWDVEHRFRGVDGKWHPILARGVPVRDEQGQITCWAGINLDISALKRTEESLRDSESRERARVADLEALMDTALAAIFTAHDAQCRHISGNRMAYALLRRPPGSNLSKSAPDSERPVNFRAMKDGIEIPPEELPMQKAVFTGQPVRNCEFDLVFEDGASVNLLGDAVPMLDENGRPRGAVGVFMDITERKRAEARLREAQKLESLGLLAGGVAHDFNNLLVGVIGNASMAQEMLPPDNPAIELLDRVVRTGEQAAHLTRQMLAYSGKGKFLVEPLNLSALIPEMSGLVQPSIPKKIALDLELEEELPPIEADRGQIQQVFMNLALNAAEAIGSREGLITVKTGVEDVDTRYIRQHREAAEIHPGRYVYLEVRDTGCGMDEATKARIFDPFFSTKFTGRGLGLAAVAGIVRGHKGAIVVNTAPGKGSCFRVLFPAAEHAAEESAVAAPKAALHGAGVVLVVDDEQVVREMAKKALERRGYTVLLADCGPAAIDILRRHPSDIALVVLDMSMPRMSGEETLPELRKIRPQVKVVVSSGYSEAETMALFQGQPVSGFIQKPYTSAGLAEKVKASIG